MCTIGLGSWRPSDGVITSINDRLFVPIKFSRGSGPTLRTLEYRKTVGPFYTDLRGTAVYSYIWHEYRRHLNLST